jgi:GntR family transcriptional repressor for pyruvate dehydrogenase complex
VLAGELAQGARLPNEADLSALFGVGRSTVREALRTLASQDLVVTSRGVSGGTFVSHPDPDKVSAYLEASIGLLSGSQAVSFAELVEARELLEPPATRLAAERREPELLERLRASVAGDTGGDALGHNVHFHQLLLEAAGNRLLAMVTGPLFAVVQTRFTAESAAAPPGFWAAMAADHGRILERVEAGDGDGAAAAMLAHLRGMTTTYRTLSAQDEPGR